MAGGLMQLVAYGAQDVYLTGNPQITFFKVVYRRHTNFSMEARAQTFNGSPGASQTQTATIQRNGDLIHRMYLELEASTVMGEGAVYDLVDNVAVEIGGQEIDKQHMDWNAVWWELTTPESQVNGLRNMLLQNTGATSGDSAHSRCSLPLNFWFCRNPGLALPLIALQYHEVKVKVLYGGSAPSAAQLWVDYIYLDTDERRRFAQASHEYLIEQVQRFTGSANSQSVTLNFNHPVKELIWVVAHSSSASGTGCQFLPMGNAGVSSPSSGTGYVPSATDDKLKVKLTLNSHDRFAERPAKYFRTVQPFQHHTRVPAPTRKVLIGGGGAAIDDDAGGVNLIKVKRSCRVLNADLVVTTASGQTDQTYALVHGTAADPDATSMSASTAAIANAAGRITFTGSAQSATNGLINTDHSVVVAANDFIGVDKTAGTAGNAVGYLEAEVEELPCLIGGDSANVSNVYCYSFALKPEEHQPSGTCNFSRIDTAKLETTATISTHGHLKVFAHNYNVLRIMSGMGGLAYSN